jgi:hypothetical protein
MSMIYDHLQGYSKLRADEESLWLAYPKPSLFLKWAANRWRDGTNKVISRLEVAVGDSKVRERKIRPHKPRDSREGVYDPEVIRRVSKKIF